MTAEQAKDVPGCRDSLVGTFPERGVLQGQGPLETPTVLWGRAPAMTSFKLNHRVPSELSWGPNYVPVSHHRNCWEMKPIRR